MRKSYYRPSYRRPYRDHRSERAQLSDQFAGIDQEIEKIFLNLEASLLDKLLKSYGKKYGERSEAYARKTYPKWKSGKVKLSGQTAKRLLELIPPLLPAEKRYELVKKLRERHTSRKTVRVTVSLGDWREKISEEVDKLVAERRAFEFDNSLKESATWLTSGDTENAKRILNALDEQEAQIRASYLEAEFKRIQHFIDTVDNTESITHTLEIPQGIVNLKIDLEAEYEQPTRLRRILFNEQPKMKQERKELIPKERQELDIIPRQNQNLLDSAFGELSDLEKSQLRKKIVDEKINIDVSEKKADQRHYDSTRDLANTIKTVQGLEATTKSDYDVRQTSETASGKIDVQVKKNKNNSNTLIVVAIVVGILFLVLASL